MELGVAPGEAQTIVDYRKGHGDFGSFDELRLVPGIDESWMGRMQDRLGVG